MTTMPGVTGMPDIGAGERLFEGKNNYAASSAFSGDRHRKEGTFVNQDLPTCAEALSTNNIAKSFPGVFALDQVSIALLRGEVHALIGENGAGKSTLLKILAGILQPDKGEILLEGKRTRLSSTLTAQKRGIGIVFQELNLVPTLDVATNIFLGHEPHARGLFSDRRKSKSKANEC